MPRPFLTASFQAKVNKPWGEEVIYTPPDLGRTGKILRVKAGCKLSLQYHEEKEETLCLMSGQALFWLENAAGEIEKIPMRPQAGYTVARRQKHRIEAVTDSVFIEVSSPEIGVTVRLADDYRRPDETEALRAEKDRGWRG